MNTQLTIRSAITVTAVAAALQALTIVPASAQTVLKFAWQLPLTNYASKGARARCAMHPGESGGSIKVETYPAGQLYRARQLYEGARTGALDLAMFALGSFSTTNPMTDIVYLPFVVPSQDRMFQALHGDLGKFVDGIAGKANLRVLAYFAGSGGQFGSKGRALRKPEDFKASRSACRACRGRGRQGLRRRADHGRCVGGVPRPAARDRGRHEFSADELL